MFSIVPLLLSVFVFYLANQIGGVLTFFAAAGILGLGVFCALLDLHAYRVNQHILKRLSNIGSR